MSRYAKDRRYYGPKEDPALLQKAFDLYLQGNSFTQIDKIIGVGKGVSNRWGAKLGWVEQRVAILKQKQKSVVQRYAEFQNDHFDEVLARQLEMANKLDNHVIKHLDRKRLSVKSVGELARAAGQSSGISGKLVGLDRLTEEKTRPLLVQVGVQVQMAGADEVNPSPRNVSSSSRHQIVEAEAVTIADPPF